MSGDTPEPEPLHQEHQGDAAAKRRSLMRLPATDGDWRRFWDIVAEESKRTLICSPMVAPVVRRKIAEAGLEAQFTLQTSPIVKDDQVLIIDENALDASLNERLQHTPLFPARPFSQDR